MKSLLSARLRCVCGPHHCCSDCPARVAPSPLRGPDAGGHHEGCARVMEIETASLLRHAYYDILALLYTYSFGVLNFSSERLESDYRIIVELHARRRHGARVPVVRHHRRY